MILTTKSITLGHSQHGKSTVAGYLYLKLLKLMGDLEESKRIHEMVKQNVDNCCEASSFPNNLRYALIYDGVRKDIYGHELSSKTITTRAFTLKIDTDDSIIELTDLPGHQSFLKRVSNAIEYSDIGVFVIDAQAIIDSIRSDEELSDITDVDYLRKKNGDSAIMPTAPKGYKKMLDGRKEEAKRIRKSLSNYVNTLKGHKTFKPRMHPPVISGVFNYLALSWHLGIRHFIFCIHKMDLVNYDNELFVTIVDTIDSMKVMLGQEVFTKEKNEEASFNYVPTAIKFGDNFEEDIDHNIFTNSVDMPWYEGKTVFNIFCDHKDDVQNNRKPIAESEPFRFQMNRYFHKWKLRRKTKTTRPEKRTHQSKGFNQPWIYGYTHSGFIGENDKVCIYKKNSDKEFSKPINLFQAGKEDHSQQNQLKPKTYGKLFLKNSDLNDTINSGKDASKFFYEGNFIVKEKDINKKAIIGAQKLTIDFTFIAGWKFSKNFHADLIYGLNKVPVQLKIIGHYGGNRCLANAELSPPNKWIPICYNNEIRKPFGKVVIELHTYVIGVGKVTEINSQIVY